MEERSLTASDLEPRFEVLKLDDRHWLVKVTAENDYEVVHQDGFYHCNCSPDDEPPWSECEHILSVQQHELQQLEADMANKGLKAFSDSLLWQIGQLEAEITRNNQSADHQIRRIQLWRESENRILEKRIHDKAILLRNYMRHSGKRTENLVHGIVRLRKQQPKITVMDSFDLDQEGFVRRIPEQRKPDLRAIRAHLNSTGEELPGIQVEFQPDKLSWEIAQSNYNVKGDENEPNESTFRKAG